MKRYFALLFMIFTLTMNTSVFAKTFVDMNTVPWQGAQSYIYKAVELGIMNGDSKTQKFRPRDNVTYCELVQTMYNVLKKTDYLYTYLEPEEVIERWRTTLEYYNIPKWAYESVSYALEHFIVSIPDVAHFMKDTKQQYASRESTAVVFGKAMTVAYDVDVNASLPYYDSNQISHTSVPYVDLLKDLGVMKGRSEHMFYPKQQINRAELAVLSCNAYDALMDEQAFDEDDMIAWMFEEGLIEWLTPQDDLSNWTIITSEEEIPFEVIGNEKNQTSSNYETEKSHFNQNNHDYDDDRQNNYNDRYDDDRQNNYNDRYDDDRQNNYNDRYDDDRQNNYNDRYDDDRQNNYNDRYDDNRQNNYNDRYDDDEDDYNDRYDDDEDDYNDRYDDDRRDDYDDRYDDDEQDDYNDRYDDDEDDYNDRYDDDYNDRYDDDYNDRYDDEDDYNDKYDDDEDDYNDEYDDEPEEEFRQDETGDIYVVTK